MQTLIPNFLTPTQAAIVIGCTDGRVRQLLRTGRLAGKKIGSRLWLISPDEVEKMRDFVPQTGRPRKNKNPG